MHIHLSYRTNARFVGILLVQPDDRRLTMHFVTNALFFVILANNSALPETSEHFINGFS